MKTLLQQNYAAIRKNSRISPRAAYGQAKRDADSDAKVWPKAGVYFNPANKGRRWVENAGDGLRRVGFADEIYSRIGHKGWYTDCYESDVLRGIVYQLPGRAGAPLYVPGYDDQDNAGCALLDFSDLHEDKDDAARAADSFAERYAEEQREYNRGWQDGMAFYDLGDELRAVRGKLRAGLAAVRQINPGLPAVACIMLRERLEQHWKESRAIIKQRLELQGAARYGAEKTGFATGSNGG